LLVQVLVVVWLHELTKAGAKVCVLEAGQPFDPADPKNITQLKWPYESPRRGAGTTRPFGDFDAAYGGWEIEGEPYTRAAGTKFDWFRSRMVGGRTNHWGRISSFWMMTSVEKVSTDWATTGLLVMTM
jgi:choline dehydrogenase-like flavoprotein